MTLLESRVEGLWWAKQSAKGTPATTADKQGRKVGGDMHVNRDDGSENYSDGSRFGDAVDFVNTLVGEGSPVLQTQPGVAGQLAAMILGSESVSGSADPYTHVATPGAAGFWMTVWKKVGATVGPLRQKFNDCRLVSLRIEGSTANKVVKITPQWLSLDAGEVFTSDPVKVIDVDLPFLFTEGQGRFAIDGSVYTGDSSFAIVISDGVTPYYGDDVVPMDVGFGVATVTLEAITIALDAAGLSRYNQQIYGTPSPTAGMKPSKLQPLPGSYVVDLQKGSLQVLSSSGGALTAGSFTLTYKGAATGSLAFGATAAQIATALNALATVANDGGVTTSGGPISGNGTPVNIVFANGQAAALTVTPTGITPGTLAIAAATPNRQLKIEVPGVHWSPDLAIAGNPDGGPTELPLAGEARSVAGQPRIRITTKSADAAAY